MLTQYKALYIINLCLDHPVLIQAKANICFSLRTQILSSLHSNYWHLFNTNPPKTMAGQMNNVKIMFKKDKCVAKTEWHCKFFMSQGFVSKAGYWNSQITGYFWWWLDSPSQGGLLMYRPKKVIWKGATLKSITSAQIHRTVEIKRIT